MRICLVWLLFHKVDFCFLTPTYRCCKSLLYHKHHDNNCLQIYEFGALVSVGVCVCTKLLQLCLNLCDPRDHSLPESSVHGSLQARILEWISLPSSRVSSQPRDRTHLSYVSCIGRQVLYHYHCLGNPSVVGWAFV